MIAGFESSIDLGYLAAPPVARAAWSDRTAALLAACSALAYRPWRDIEAGLPDLGLVGLDWFDAGGTQAYLAVSDGGGFAVLAFRGTEKDRADVLADLDARFYRTAAGRAHRGFSLAWGRVADSVAASLGRVGDFPLYLAGHSLGGALATVAAQVADRDNLAAVYTFGSPRVGDGDFGRAIKAPVYRVVNAGDPVPWVPFLAMGYRHVGDVRYLTERGALVAAPNDIAVTAAFAWRLAKARGLVHRLVPCHAIGAYFGKLAAIARARRS